MYARSNTIQAEPARMEELIAYVAEEVMPLTRAMDGNVGLSMLTDRDSGRVVVTTTWESEEAMRASASGVQSSRQQAGRIAGGRPEVTEWEVAAMHRLHEIAAGSCARVIWAGTGPGDLDQALEAWRATVPPALDRIDGFCSVSLLVDRGRRLSVAATAYRDRDALRASAGSATALRERSAADMGLDITEVAEFDVALAHLRVPEMA